MSQRFRSRFLESLPRLGGQPGNGSVIEVAWQRQVLLFRVFLDLALLAFDIPGIAGLHLDLQLDLREVLFAQRHAPWTIAVSLAWWSI